MELFFTSQILRTSGTPTTRSMETCVNMVNVLAVTDLGEISPSPVVVATIIV
jgi:hypothetical protein